MQGAKGLCPLPQHSGNICEILLSALSLVTTDGNGSTPFPRQRLVYVRSHGGLVAEP